ncbi:MAG TPA: trypsin-like peptidase domain-containing protein [Acidimicrobiales bacterium]|mgnify:FL=1|nr:trypsin-like peptidase domain-containing protein [Acidimicrobiales bacterium]HJL90116.1 trypsin-like peptidase domain-containing protein [Acidimicrobiales bacterium]
MEDESGTGAEEPVEPELNLNPVDGVDPVDEVDRSENTESKSRKSSTFGLTLGVVVLVATLFIGGTLTGWIVRGPGTGGIDVQMSRGGDGSATETVVAALVDELVARSQALSPGEIRDLVDRLIEQSGAMGKAEVTVLVDAMVAESASQFAGLSADEVEVLVEALIAESAGMSSADTEALVDRLFTEARVRDGGPEPVVAVAEALTPSVVLVTEPDVGQGSGIALDDLGHVVTNAHVVGEATDVIVTLPSGRSVEATVLGADIRRDVAVVLLSETDDSLRPAVFGSSDDLRVGQTAVAVGSPFDLNRTVTAGIVSALGRVVPSYGCQVGGDDSALCAGVAMIQTDAPINPGNSGGPLADRRGRVIGMNTSIRTDGFLTANIGVGFALPSDTVLLVAERLLAGKPVGTAWLGIRGESLTDGRAGASIVEVTEGSPAAIAGLMEGDLIVGSDGRPIDAMDALRADIQLRLPGMEVALEFMREGELLSTVVELGALDDFLSNGTATEEQDPE